jgi:signal transduction histidine kinase
MRFYKSLAFKLTIAFLVFLTFFLVFALGISAYIFKGNLSNYFKRSPFSVAEAVAKELADDLSRDLSFNELNSRLDGLSLRYGASIIIYDPNGVPIATSGLTKSSCDTPWCSGPMGGPESRTVTVPIYFNNRILGFVGVVVNRETSIIGAVRKFEQSMFYSFTYVGLMVLLVSLFVAYFVSSRIARPLVQASKAALRLAEGKYNVRLEKTGMLEIDRLSSALNLLATRLEQIEKRRLELASDIVHEFKTPLSVLKANIEGMKDGVIEASPEYLDKLSGEIDRLAKLIDQLKTIQMLDEKQLSPSFESIDLKEFIGRLIEIYRPMAEEKQIDVISELSQIYCLADSGYLQRIFSNLFANAVTYTEKGGRIYITTFKRDGMACFKITDKGIGINKDELPLVFERFYRAEGSRSRKTGGSGLGLAIVKKLVEAMDGKVTIESEIGKGTTVTICLPIAEPT